MIEFDDETYERSGIKGLLMQLGKHLLFLVIGVTLLALPCYFVFLILLEGD